MTDTVWKTIIAAERETERHKEAMCRNIKGKMTFNPFDLILYWSIAKNS